MGRVALGDHESVNSWFPIKSTDLTKDFLEVPSEGKGNQGERDLVKWS